MTPEEFVKRLQAISEENGVSYRRVQLILDAEEQHARSTLRFKGYSALSDAFKCFFLQSVEMLNVALRSASGTPLSEFYPQFVERLAHAFRSLCGAERIAVRGYPFQAYTLLRNVYDDLVLTAAVAQGLTDFYTLEGIDPKAPFDPAKFRKDRRAAEASSRRQMTGDDSGLSPNTRRVLATWDVLFDDETHGGRLSRAHGTAWLRGSAPLPVVPLFEEQPFALFMNRFCEIGWMTHRMVPLAKPNADALPISWKEKWRVIDESFQQTVESLSKQLGKEIGNAMVELVRVKFPFNESSSFWC
jgi:hypothetical protein